MWYLVKGERLENDRMATGSRAVLTAALLFFAIAVGHSVMGVVAEVERIGPLHNGILPPTVE